MPTPTDILIDPATLVVLALPAGLALWEALPPGRALPPLRVVDMPLARDVSRPAC